MKLDRKEFLRTALAMAGLGFVGSRIAGCGGDATSDPSGAAGSGGGNTNACEADAPVETIATNHGHVLEVSQADVAAGTLKMYSIMGTSAHDHTVTVSPGNFTTLRAGNTVQLTSSSGSGHTHGITIVCA